MGNVCLQNKVVTDVIFKTHQQSIVQVRESQVLTILNLEYLPTNITENCEISSTIKYKCGITYTGQQRHHQRHGFGVLHWTGIIVINQMEFIMKVDGQRTLLKGRENWFLLILRVNIENNLVEGSWKNNRLHGFATYADEFGYSYQGYWNDGRKSGLGKEVYGDDHYEGYFENDVKSGFGVYNCDEFKFEGYFKNDKFNGNGTIQWSNGNKYRGEFQENYLHGYGCFEWRDGRKYEGQYNHNMKHGYGKYEWENEQSYEGYWRDGQWDGKGKLTVHGEITIGEWSKGQRLKL